MKPYDSPRHLVTPGRLLGISLFSVLSWWVLWRVALQPAFAFSGQARYESYRSENQRGQIRTYYRYIPNQSDSNWSWGSLLLILFASTAVSWRMHASQTSPPSGWVDLNACPPELLQEAVEDPEVSGLLLATRKAAPESGKSILVVLAPAAFFSSVLLIAWAPALVNKFEQQYFIFLGGLALTWIWLLRPVSGSQGDLRISFSPPSLTFANESLPLGDILLKLGASRTKQVFLRSGSQDWLLRQSEQAASSHCLGQGSCWPPASPVRAILRYRRNDRGSERLEPRAIRCDQFCHHFAVKGSTLPNGNRNSRRPAGERSKHLRLQLQMRLPVHSFGSRHASPAGGGVCKSQLEVLNMKRTCLVLLVGATVAHAKPVLTAAQSAQLKKSKIPVYLPAYTPTGYELREVIGDQGGAVCYQLVYVRKGQPAIGMHQYLVEGIKTAMTRSYQVGGGVKSYPVRHPTLGKAQLWFLPDKMRGGPLGLQPLLKGPKAGFYDLEGNLEIKEALKVLESLESFP